MTPYNYLAIYSNPQETFFTAFHRYTVAGRYPPHALTEHEWLAFTAESRLWADIRAANFRHRTLGCGVTVFF